MRFSVSCTAVFHQAEKVIIISLNKVVCVISMASILELLYPDSGISMDEENVLGDMIWSYNKAEL